MKFSSELERISMEAEAVFSQTPEFCRIPPKNVLRVPVGSIGVGTRLTKFRSREFDRCSGMAIKDQYEQIFALFHAYPAQKLTGEDRKTLEKFINGSICLVQGTNSADKRRLLHELTQEFGLTHLDTIPIDTCLPNGRSFDFHMAYRPAANQILVARISHGDVLTFPRFCSVTSEEDPSVICYN